MTTRRTPSRRDSNKIILDAAQKVEGMMPIMVKFSTGRYAVRYIPGRTDGEVLRRDGRSPHTQRQYEALQEIEAETIAFRALPRDEQVKISLVRPMGKE